MIRKAEITDIEDIILLFEELDKDAELFQPQNYTFRARDMNYISRILEEEYSLFYVYELEKKLIGFIHAQTKKVFNLGPLVEANYLYINDLIISAEYRNMNFGSLLVSKIFDLSKELNCDYVRVSVLAEKTLTRNFYHTNGFNESLITMEKRLK